MIEKLRKRDFEVAAWSKRTQPSGPLCLWQCFDITWGLFFIMLYVSFYFFLHDLLLLRQLCPPFHEFVFSPGGMEEKL